MNTVKVPIVGTIEGEDGRDPEVFPLEAFRAMFQTPAYDPKKAMAKALDLLPYELHQDQYYLPVALIFANVSALEKGWNKYCFQPAPCWPIEIDDLKKYVFGTLSSGELFLAKLSLHLFNDCNKLPKDGLLGLRNLDSYHFDLAMHALRLFTRGRR